ncbi:hypothetical protein EG68_00439 [Paragonimus skrjabini miyazakii]|uniref:Uncharacterized protein n=1 Tax=Paragonimus skrjabini miyazakii TaxID=59628 RepID=A0A8S9ZCP3_9TREM|nr:hypothetical protein EG68_00439 [Paragonimus skrjabini miyazakii]
MFYILFYLYRNRLASMEAVEQGHLSASRILFSKRGESVSLYLRIGLCRFSTVIHYTKPVEFIHELSIRFIPFTVNNWPRAMFASMSIVFSVYRALQVVSIDVQIGRIAPYTASRISFYIVQTIFLLLLHRLVVLAKLLWFRFLLLHLLTVNLCIWMDSAIEKVSKTADFPHESDVNQTILPKHHPAVKATNYCLPAVSEYCAIAAAIIYEMTLRIGQAKQIQNTSRTPEHYEHRWTMQQKCGMGFALAICICILAVILFLETAGERIDQIRTIIHLVEMGFIHLTALSLCVIGIRLVRPLKFTVNFAKNSIDEKLLLVTFFIKIQFLIASIVLCILYLSHEMPNREAVVLMSAQLAGIVAELFQVVVQTYFIHDMFYRCCHHECFQRDKPGRSSIILLAAFNFSLWMIYSFQMKNNDVLFTKNVEPLDLTGVQGLHIFISVTLPMTMLYRYHSSVCLAVCAVRIYEDEVERYESMLRWVKQGTIKDFLHKQSINLRHPFIKAVEGVSLLQSHDVSVPVHARKMHEESPYEPQQSVPKCGGNHAGYSEGSDIGSQTDLEKFEQNRNRGRRDTTVNMEMARVRVVASEVAHRMIESKLRKHQLT